LARVKKRKRLINRDRQDKGKRECRIFESLNLGIFKLLKAEDSFEC